MKIKSDYLLYLTIKQTRSTRVAGLVATVEAGPVFYDGPEGTSQPSQEQNTTPTPSTADNHNDKYHFNLIPLRV